MKQRTAVGLTLAALTSAFTFGQATSTNSISLQAKLDGITGPTANLTVKFFDALTGGTQVGATITLSNVPVQNGIVSVPVSPVDATIFSDSTRYMEIAANGTALSPRTLVTSVPFAISAASLASDHIAIAGSPDPNLAAYNVRLSDSPNVHVEHIPNFHGTGRSADFYKAIGSAWNRGVGFGFFSGYEIASPVIYMYGGTINNTFEVRKTTDLSMAGGSTLFSVSTDGTTSVHVLQITGADVAEPFNVAMSDSTPAPVPGMVVSIDPANPGTLKVCTTPYDKKVAGAISGANGLSVGVVMGKDNTDPLIAGKHPVAMSGRVYVWCDASFAAITPGDRLTTSQTPGHAMKVADESRAPGAVIGKAMTGLEDGKGLVLVLVNLQ